MNWINSEKIASKLRKYKIHNNFLSIPKLNENNIIGRFSSKTNSQQDLRKNEVKLKNNLNLITQRKSLQTNYKKRNIATVRTSDNMQINNSISRPETSIKFLENYIGRGRNIKLNYVTTINKSTKLMDKENISKVKKKHKFIEICRQKEAFNKYYNESTKSHLKLSMEDMLRKNMTQKGINDPKRMRCIQFIGDFIGFSNCNEKLKTLKGINKCESQNNNIKLREALKEYLRFNIDKKRESKINYKRLKNDYVPRCIMANQLLKNIK